MKEVTNKIKTKVAYYEKQYNSAIDRWIDSNNRRDKESAIRIKERIKCYKEITELIKE